MIEDELKEFPIVKEIDVYWGDMDAARHVNNTVYLRWFESMRIEYLNAALDTNLSFVEGESGVIVAKVDCKYIFPMTYPDTAIVGVRVSGIAEDRFIQSCKIFSKQHGRLVAIATCLGVIFDYGLQKKAPMPEEMRNAILKMEGEREVTDMNHFK